MGRRYPSIATAITAVIAQACGLVTYDPMPPAVNSAGSAGRGGAGGGGGTSGSSGIGTAGTLSLGTAGTLSIDPAIPTDCPPAAGLLADQVVDEVATQRTFYSWTTSEQVAELRAGGQLFSRSERPGLGRGLVFEELSALAASEQPASALARALGEQIFATARFAWPNPWATLLGFPGESYGDQLLSIELKPEAWIAHFQRGSLRVIDAAGKEVPLDEALLTPGRIGAIYFRAAAATDSGYCGTFSQGGVGFREFALGNLSMVARWSLATPDMIERTENDLKALREVEAQLRCLRVSSEWAAEVECDWDRRYRGGSVLENYEFSLALPSELYRPTAENLAALVASVEACMPTGEPLTVVPEP